MSWEGFSYICRKATATLKDNESTSECISRIQRESSCNMYGKKIRIGSLSQVILNEISKINDHGKTKQILGLYSQMNPSQYLSETIRFKRAFIYLIWVAFVFYAVGAIYNSYVAPSFIGLFESFDITVPAGALVFHQYWWLVVCVVTVLLTLAIIIGFELKKLLQFQQNSEKGLIFRYLIFSSVKKKYLGVINILYFPLSLAGNDHPLHSEFLRQEIIDHLNNVHDSSMDLNVELQCLLKSETTELFNCCEQQMRVMSVIVAIAIITAIFFFLVSAYSPLFILGEVI